MRFTNISCLLTVLVPLSSAFNANDAIQNLEILGLNAKQRVLGGYEMLKNGLSLTSHTTQLIENLSAQIDNTSNNVSEGYRSYKDIDEVEMNDLTSKELISNLKELEDQYVFRFEGWDSPKVEKNILVSAKSAGLDVWAVSRTHKFVDVRCNETQMAELVKKIDQTSPAGTYTARLMISDLPQAIFETLDVSSNSWKKDHKDLVDSMAVGTMPDGYSPETDIFFKQFRQLNTIYEWFDILVQTYPELLSIEWIGQTYEGRDMKALRISGHKGNGKPIKTVVITGGIHAREWISISTVCYIISGLLSDYDAGNKKVKMYFDNLDFLFLPVMNPDGYAYTWKNERLWRKNRQQTYHPRCFGIDIDHSFNFHFARSLDSPCSEDYSGQVAFECLESYAWDKHLNETKHKHPIYAYIDLHSYAEEVLYPYAYSCTELPRDEENLLELAYGLAQAIRLQSGKAYNVLSACEDRGADLLPVMGAGSALDYMYHNKAYSAFVLKLRDSGSRGFLLPAKFILPVGREIYSAIKYFADFLLAPDS